MQVGDHMRKLTKQTIKPVVHFTKVNVNSGYYKWYHFTLDYYNDKPSFQGGTAYDLDGCYTTPRYDKGETQGKPFDQYAINLETGDVIELSSKKIVMQEVL